MARGRAAASLGVSAQDVTSAERAALIAVCQPGSGYDEAAYALGITRRALRHRLDSLYRKLGVNNAAQAVWALYGGRTEHRSYLPGPGPVPGAPS